MIVQNLAVERGQWVSFLCCYVVCEMEKTICPLPRLKFILNSIKNVHAPKKPQRVISATRGWEYFAKDYLWTVFPRVLLWNPLAYSNEVGECQKVLVLRSQIKPCLFSKCLWKHFVKTCWWSFFVLRNAKFLNSKMPRNSLEEKFCLLKRVLYREKITCHGWSVSLTYCYRLYDLSAFSYQHAVLRKL